MPKSKIDSKISPSPRRSQGKARPHADDALRVSEERFRLAIRATHTLVFDLDARTLKVNALQGLPELLGHEPAQIPVTLAWWNRQIHPKDRGICRRAIEDMLIDHRDKAVSYRIRHQDGRFLWVEDRATPVCDPRGKVVRIVGTVTDITARKQAEDSLRQFSHTLEQKVARRTAQAQVRSQQLRRLVGELVASEERERHKLAKVLHDHLQQLLVATRMKVAAASGKVQAPPLRDLLGQAQELLNQSIQESRSLTAQLSPTVLYESGLAAALDWLKPWMKEKHDFEVHIAYDQPLVGLHQSLQVLLFQVVRELLFNAVKHSGVKAACVSLRRTKGQVVVEVADQGRGFDPARIAAPKGFGLFSIRERLELLGGHLDIASAPGKGTHLTLRVPVKQIPAGTWRGPARW